MNTIICRSLTALCLLMLTSCAHYLVNDQKSNYDENYGYRYPEKALTSEQDKIYVALVFSGGGTRAAALSYGVMDKLNETMIANNAKTLLSEVDVISSVSGGSFTAAYYGLFGEELFNDFKSQFLYRNIQGELASKLYNPVNWARLASPNYNRIDLAIELYNETVFKEKTFQDLNAEDNRPFIALNATNLTTGSQFTFTQPSFDVLGSDLSTLPIARAVASSSAFPFLLSPVSFKNYPASHGFSLNRDITNALDDEYEGRNPRRYMWAYNQAIYHNDKSAHPYVHLMDGGLSDNIGTRYLIDQYNHSKGFLFQRRTSMKELVVIIVNAKTLPPEKLDQDESPPNLIDVAMKTATISLDNYSFESIDMIRNILKVGEREAKIILDCQSIIDKQCTANITLPTIPHHFKVTTVEINFLNLKDKDQQKRMLSLPTTFSLSEDQVDELIDVGGKLLMESSAFKALIERLQ